jgi:hypothetical protein
MHGRERYNMLLKQSRERGEVKGPLGIPGWKPISKASRKYLIQEGKLPDSMENLRKINTPKAKKKITKSEPIPSNLSKADLEEIMRRNRDKGMIILK